MAEENPLLLVEVTYELETGGQCIERRRRFRMTKAAFDQMRTAELRKKYLPGWAHLTGAVWRIEALMAPDVRIKSFHRVRIIKETPQRDPWRWYTVYSKTDEVVASGTAEHCAKVLGYKSRAGFDQMIARAKHGKIAKYRVIVEDKSPDIADMEDFEKGGDEYADC